jgi:CRP-like cAMP-binding protein
MLKEKDKKANCITCTNAKCLIKKHVHNKGMENYIEKKHTIICKKNQQFILEGAPLNGLFFIFKGKVKVTKTGIYGREQIVRFAKDGNIIGHRGFGAGNRYPVSASSLEDTVLCNFTNDVLNEMLHKIPDLTFDLMMFYAEELNKSENKVRKIAQMTVREKVIDALLYILRKFKQSPDGYLNITLSRQDIADYAGTTEEQVIRVISGLKKENFLRADGKKIGIVNDKLLKKEISEHNYYLDN